MKLPEILKKWPPNTVATSQWLQEEGISRQLVAKYCHSGWLEKVENGAYKKPGETIDWTGAVYALQTQLKLQVHPGGVTALELHGVRHHLPVAAKQDVYLLGEPKTLLPRWFLKKDWSMNLHFRCSGFLPSGLGLEKKELRGNYALLVSSSERAILEVLDEVTDAHSFEDAAHLVESLLSLKENVVLQLLTSCQSMRTRRLFLFLAKYCALPVYDSLKAQNIDIGKGIIQIVPEGKFIREFGITVPLNFKEKEGNPF